MKITLDESIFIKNNENLQEAESPWDKLERTYGNQLDITDDKSKKNSEVVDPNSAWGKLKKSYGDQLDLDESKSMNAWDKLVAYYGDELTESKLEEDTVKQGNKWVNKGKEGTHGTFKTKKEADAQRKAMFSQGYKEGLNEMLDKYHFYDVQEFEAGTPERSRLELVASILTKESGKGRKYEVTDTWMDYGSQLAWTTITYTDPDDNYGVQILSPKEWADLLNAENDDEINQVIDQITSDEYWSDTKLEQPDQEVNVDVDVDEKLNEEFDFDGDLQGDEDVRFFDSGREFKIVETHDTKDVDGYELSIVHVEDVDDSTDWFYVLLDGDVEWGPEDTYEGAKSWYDTVNDGYYVDDEPAWGNYDDDMSFDDDYSEEDLKTLFGDDVRVESLGKSDECEEGLITNVLSKIPIVNKVSDFLFGEDVNSDAEKEATLNEEQKKVNPAANEIKSDPAFNDYDDEW